MSDIGDLANAIGQFVNVLFSQPAGIRTWTDDSSLAYRTNLAGMMLDTSLLGAVVPDRPAVSPADRVHQQIVALQQIDPDFNEMQFLAQATTQYGAAMAAESLMNPDAFGGIATPSFIEWFRKRVSDWTDAGIKAVVKNVSLSGSTIIRVTADGTGESIVVRFSGAGIRNTQDAATGTLVDGSLQSETFSEFATFVRPAGTTTPKSVGAGGATHCPACGAPTTAGAAMCPFCGTQLTGTGSIWLLDKLSASAYT